MRYLLFACLLTNAMVAQPNAARERVLEGHYDAHRWFELRTAEGLGNFPFFAGAAAVAFDQLEEASRHLESVLRDGRPAGRVEEAHHLLINACLRRGTYRRAREILERGAAEFESLRGLKPLIDALAAAPDLAVTQRKASKLPRDAKRQGIIIPLTINGRKATYVVDTGANFCVLTISEAERHGLRIVDVGAGIANSAGQSIPFRIAVADDVVVGDCHVKHVAFLVFPDAQQPFNGMPATSRGAVGLPLLLALRTLGWTQDSIDVGTDYRPSISDAPNLAFDGLFPIVQATVGNHSLSLVLDSGARVTHLWKPLFETLPEFAAAAVAQPAKKTHGVGGSTTVENAQLPAVTLVLGGRKVTLAPAEIHLTPTTGQSHYYHGNLGRDLLSQTKRVQLDFRAMRLTLD